MPVMQMLPNPVPANAPGNPLLVQQQQLALQQELAQAMLAKSLGDYSPIIHTGGNNPFARDVPNYGGAISQIANAVLGKYGLQSVAEGQSEFAKAYQAQRSQDTQNMIDALQGYNVGVPGPDGSTPARVAGNPLHAIQMGLMSSVPEVQQLGQSLLKAWMENQAAQTPKPGDMGRLLAHVTPESLGQSIVQGPLGSVINPSTLQLIPKIMEGPGGTAGTMEPKLGAQVQPGGALIAPKQPIVNPGEALPGAGAGGAVPPPDAAAGAPGETPPAQKNLTMAPLTYGVSGVPEAMKTPLAETLQKAAQGKMDQLEFGQKQAQGFIQGLPKYQEMLSILSDSNFGFGGKQITQAKQFLRRLGLSEDQVGSIDKGDPVTNQQTFLKLAVSQIARPLKEITGSRPNLVAFQQVADSVAANANLEPQAVKNIMMNMVLDGFNQYKEHLLNIQQTKDAFPGLGSAPDSYKVVNFPKINEEGIPIGVLNELNKVGVPTNVGIDPESGYLRNLEIGPGTTPQLKLPVPGAGAPATPGPAVGGGGGLGPGEAIKVTADGIPIVVDAKTGKPPVAGAQPGAPTGADPYISRRMTKDGRLLGQKLDGTIEVIPQ